MYDLIDIIDIKLSGMEQLIHKWMINNHLIKFALLDDIKLIKNNINKYHNKYVNCKYWMKYGDCKYGSNCWYLHPTIGNSRNKYDDNRKKNTKFREKKEDFSANRNDFLEFSDKNENDNIDSEYFYIDNATDSDESDDSDYDDNSNNDNNDNNIHKNKTESEQGWQSVKKRQKRKKKIKYKKKDQFKNEIAETKKKFKKKDNLKVLLTKTNNPHWQHLIEHYKCGICFKYMNGNCNDTNCQYKHPERCIHYTHNNGFRCDYKDKCNFAHIDDKFQKNGIIVKKQQNKKDNMKDGNENDNHSKKHHSKDEKNKNYNSKTNDNANKTESKWDEYQRDENGNVLFDTLDEYLQLTEMGIPCKKKKILEKNPSEYDNSEMESEDVSNCDNIERYSDSTYHDSNDIYSNDNNNSNENESDRDDDDSNNDGILISDISEQFISTVMKYYVSKEKWGQYCNMTGKKKKIFYNTWKHNNDTYIYGIWRKCRGNVQRIKEIIKENK